MCELWGERWEWRRNGEAEAGGLIFLVKIHKEEKEEVTADRSVIGDALPNVRARTGERVDSQERGSPEFRTALWAGIQNGRWTASLLDRVKGKSGNK